MAVRNAEYPDTSIIPEYLVIPADLSSHVLVVHVKMSGRFHGSWIPFSGSDDLGIGFHLRTPAN